MKKATLDYYIALDKQFKERCVKVANELSRFDNDEYGYCDCFYLSDDGKTVEAQGDEYWPFGGYEHHRCSFPVELLTYSDEKLKKYVDDKIEELKVERRKQEEAEQERKKKKELAELARLKAKYGEDA